MSIQNIGSPAPQIGEINQTTNTEAPQSNSGVWPNPSPATTAANHPSTSSMTNNHNCINNKAVLNRFGQAALKNLGRTVQNKHVKFTDKVKANREIYNGKVAAAGGNKKEIKQAKKERRKENWNAFKDSFKHVFGRGIADMANKSQKLAQKNKTM